MPTEVWSVLRARYMTDRVETIRRLDGADMIFVTVHHMHLATDIRTNIASFRGDIRGGRLQSKGI